MILRDYAPEDVEALVRVYREAARVQGRKVYTEAHAEAWAAHADVEEFREIFSEGKTVCSLVDDAVMAFGQLHPASHVKYLYCAPEHARQGHGAAILAELEKLAQAEGVACTTVDASAFARPFFEKYGYVLDEEERVDFKGLEFLRYKMSKEQLKP